MMMDELLLLSGNDIPFPEAQLIIHQPRLKEIAYINEQNFWLACQLLKFNKENLTDKDKNDLMNRSNFNIVMTMIQEKSLESQRAKVDMLALLALMFPTEKILLKKNVIQMQNYQTNEIREINEDNFKRFQQILISIFCLANEQTNYNPSGDAAKRIADKFKQGQARKNAQTAQKQQKIAILSRYVSILAVGELKNIPDLMNYTVYQLLDEFKRFNLKLRADTYQRYRVAGATGMEQPEDWFKDLYIKENKNTNMKTLYI